MSTLELDFLEYWRLVDQMVDISSTPSNQFDFTRNSCIAWVTKHGGRIKYVKALDSRIYARIKFRSPQELDIFVLKYM